MKSERITVNPVKPYEDLNIRIQYEIQNASWVNHPNAAADKDSFLEYSLPFSLANDSTFIIHCSADQRFELFCDDQYIGMGPDRSDLKRWSFHSYKVDLPAGKHELKAKVYYIVTHMPHAQVTHRPGFILAGENCPVDLNTGSAKWQVRELKQIKAFYDRRIPNYHVVGPDFITDKNTAETSDAVDVSVIAVASFNSRTGPISGDWSLFPTRLPEQLRTPVYRGKVRMVSPYVKHQILRDTDTATNNDWQQLITEKRSLTIAANTELNIIVDLDEYMCAFPEVVLSKGKNSSIQIHWAEACFVPNEDGKTPQHNMKTNRNEINDKIFVGYGDVFIAGGEDNSFFTSPWWRAGRYLNIVVKTASEPLTINSIGLAETRLPLENEGQFDSSDSDIHNFIPIAVRGIQMCAHETYMDCPYYEQMMYVGDTRPQILTSYVMNRENRLNMRALELFDWSRHVTGYVLERHPSTPRQLSTTFSMVWILMLRDFSYWKNEPEFVKERLTGLRSLLESFKSHQGDMELLHHLPGWSFIDWVPEWNCGYAPDGEFGTSGVNNMLFLLALKYAAEVEQAYGEQHLAAYNLQWAERIATAIKKNFWDEQRGLFADDLKHEWWSEHSQCLALLSGMFDQETANRCFESLISTDDLCRTTVYFSFYLLDTLNMYGRGDLIYQKLDFWKNLYQQGFKTPVEAPEPSRSDCHAWGSHPLFHLHASIAGIRPATPGFRTVNISPKPSVLTTVSSTIPHPDGEIQLEMKRESEEWQINVNLPKGITGRFNWQGQTIELTEKNSFKVNAY